MKTLLLLTTVLCLSLLLQGATAKSDEDRLVSSLLKELKLSDRIARPVSDAKDNVTVTLGLALIRVASVKDGSAELDAWLSMSWKEPRLRWDARKYGGLRNVALPANRLWLPDVRPYSSMGYQPDKETASRVVIYADSRVLYVLPARMRTDECEALRNQSVVCKIVLGSWVYNGFQVDLRKASQVIDLNYFVAKDWDVVSTDADRQVKKYACCPEPYVSIRYSVTLNPKTSVWSGK